MSLMNATTYPDDTLVANAMRGDLEAFNQLVLSYQDLAYGLARSLLDDPFHAEDVTQESFIKAFQKIGQFRGGSFRSWLLKIVTHTAIDHLRRYKRQVTIPLYLEDEQGEEMESPSWLADPGPSTEAIMEQGELRGYIQRLLYELPETYRSVISLIDLYELDYKEAAEILNVPMGTIKSRLARARLQMKGKILSSQVIEVQ
jgi:RNA polymerase sigma-70 factor (ECF subfamily)